MDILSHRLVDVTENFLLSRTVRALLSRALITRTAPPTIDIQSFIATILSSRSRSTAVTVVQSLFSNALESLWLQVSDANREARSNSPDTMISEGLWNALEEAQSLRLATGGNDQFVGLRYLVFAILTSQEDSVVKETRSLFSVTRVDRRDAATAIARYCVERHELAEDYYVWRRVLNERGLSPALDTWPGDIPPPPPDAPSGTSFSLPRDPSIALLQPDDPWALQTHDHSGAALEAAAFADMVVAKPFRPPLAVGIFGDWGSGKSYFMRMLYDAVADNRQRYALARQTGGITFCQNVVQIRFNAWHYAEEHLWASLVDHIFTSLNQWAISTGSTTNEADQLFDQLTTARRLTIEAATELVDSRILKDKAAKELASAEATLRDKQANAEVDPRNVVQAAFDSVLHDASVGPKLAKAAEKLGLAGLADSAQSLLMTSSELSDEVSRFAMLRSGVARQLAAPAVIGLVIAGTLLLPPLFALIVNWLGVPAAEFGAGVAGLVAPLVAALGWAGQQTKKALDIVGKYRAGFDAEIEKATEADKAKVSLRAKELADAEAAVLEARRSLNAATISANDAALAYNVETGGGRVLRFIRDRVAAGEYAKHLSFVASIRKDFEELSRLLAKVEPPTREVEDARKAHEKRVAELLAKAGSLLDDDEKTKLQATTALSMDSPKIFDRIILYIDDLDRCQPEQVVEVLQAVHLLLTFPLFVVFVAVDVRWIRNALLVRYPDQLGASAATPGNGRATTSDYLEKIFQIPYWVRPFGPKVTQALLADRIGPPTLEPMPSEMATAPDVPLSHDDAAEGAADIPPLGQKSEQQAGPSVRPLIMTAEERSCIESVAATLDGLPRRTLRFINTYWIIKSGLDPVAQAALEASGYRSLIALLAVAVGLGEDFPTLADALTAPDTVLAANGNPHPSEASPTVLAADKIAEGLLFGRPNALQHVKSCLSATGNPGVTELRKYADVVSRFSFYRGG